MSIPIEKTLDDVRRDLFTRIEAVQAEYVDKGWMPSALNLNKGVVRGLIELWAWGLYALYQFMVIVLRQAFPETATGKWLDLHCAQVGVTRKMKTKTVGKVVFGRSMPAGNVTIPAGCIVRTLPDGLGNIYRYMTTADVVMQDGTTEVEAPVVAEEYGAAGNVSVGAIREIAIHVPGVESVTNKYGWITSEGCDDESDEALRNRYRLAWMDVNGATKYAYESWAMSVTGVTKCFVLDNHPRGPGTVDVIVLGSAGPPTEQLLMDVTAAIDRNKPINDDVEIRGPELFPIAIRGQIEVWTGVPEQIADAVRVRIAEYFNQAGSAPIGIGQDVTLDRLSACALGVYGVKRVIWTEPAQDVGVPEGGLAVLQSIELNAELVEP